MSHDGQLDGREVRPSEVHWFRADRRPFDSGLQRLPRWQQVHGNTGHLRRLPHGGFQQDEQSAACASGLPDQLPDLPQYHRVGSDDFRPQHVYEVPADGRTHDRCLHAVPHQRAVCGHAHRLRLVPYKGFQRYDQSEPCAVRIPHRVPAMSHYRHVEQRDI